MELNAAAKSPEMTKMLNDLGLAMFGATRTDSIADARCLFCKQPVGPFRDDLSKKEFTISGLCQACQDSVFGIDEEAAGTAAGPGDDEDPLDDEDDEDEDEDDDETAAEDEE